MISTKKDLPHKSLINIDGTKLEISRRWEGRGKCFTTAKALVSGSWETIVYEYPALNIPNDRLTSALNSLKG